MREPAGPTWAEIDLSALVRSSARLRERAGARGMIGVVKANAYGHGAIAVRPSPIHLKLDTGMGRLGLLPEELEPALDRSAPFEPVMTLLSRVSHAKQVPAGARIGYGRIYVTAFATRILTLPIGYADGIPRSAAAHFRVGVGGERRPLAGRISMDLKTVHAGPDSRAGVGDPVLIFGRMDDLEIRVEELADAAGTISYEILVGIGPRVPRRA